MFSRAAIAAHECRELTDVAASADGAKLRRRTLVSAVLGTQAVTRGAAKPADEKLPSAACSVFSFRVWSDQIRKVFGFGAAQ